MVINEVKTVREGAVRGVVVINLILTMALITLDLTPYLSRNVRPLIRCSLFVLWLISSFSIPIKKYSQKQISLLGWWMIFVLWNFMMSIVGHSNTPVIYLILRLTLYGIPYMMVTVMNSYNNKELSVLWKVFLLIFVINLLDNYYLGILNPDIFEHVTSTTDSAFSTNAGSTGLVFLCLFMVPVFWIIHEETTKRKSRKMALIVMVLSAGYLMFINSRATAFMILLLMVMLYFIMKVGGEKVAWSKLVIIGGVVVALFVVFSGQILTFFSEIFASDERMAARISSLSSASQGVAVEDLNEGSLALRYILWETSINTFLANPQNFILGIGDNVTDGDFYSLMADGVGRHSEFFDLAAKFGIIGIVIVFMFLSRYFSYIRHLTISKKQMGLLMVMLVAFVLYSFVNSTFKEGSFYLFMIFLPISFKLLNNNKI